VTEPTRQPTALTGEPNLFLLLERRARERPDAPAVVVGHGEESATYGELLRRASFAAGRFRQLGVRAGDRVAVWLPNGTDWVVAAFATARLGAVVVPVSTRWTHREAEQLFAIVRPRLLVVGGGLQRPGVATSSGGQRPPGWPEMRVVLEDAGALGQEGAVLEEPCVVAEPSEPGPSSRCHATVGAVLATSGTTSRPKAVMLRHTSLTRLAAHVARRQQLTPADRLYTIAPFYHCSGLVHGLLVAFSAGCCLYVTRKYRPAEVGEVMRSARITSYHGFALPLREAARLPEFDAAECGALRGAWFSAPAPEMAFLEDVYDTPMCELYGLTESCGNAVMTSLEDQVSVRHHTDGYPHDGIEIGIFVPGTGEQVRVGDPGEIRIRGWNVMRGYFGDPEATARAIDPEGWLRTGDTGRLDASGNLTFLARNDDMVRVGGENVSPAEVEEVLSAHPDVEEASVIGVDDERLGSVLVAFVVLGEQAAADTDQLRHHCAGCLAPFKVPREIRVLDALPKTAATLRVQRAVLRRGYDAQRSGPSEDGAPFETSAVKNAEQRRHAVDASPRSGEEST
jgi:acyl-CoA synthetase (AMP-forming)/AMP-acid ligase II